MPYPNNPRSQGSPPPQARYSSQRNDQKWGEEKAEEAIRKMFGTEYCKKILSVSPEEYHGHVDRIKEYMKQNAGNISTSQLRNIFSRIRPINDYRELAILRPKLAYISGREEKNEAIKTLLYLLDQLIIAVDNGEKLRRFHDFVEALVAYHKYWGGKN